MRPLKRAPAAIAVLLAVLTAGVLMSSATAFADPSGAPPSASGTAYPPGSPIPSDSVPPSDSVVPSDSITPSESVEPTSTSRTAPGSSTSSGNAPSSQCAAGVSNANPAPGASDSASGCGFTPGELVSFDLHSTVVHLGEATADSTGAVSLAFTIPASFSGNHTVTLTGAASGRVQSISLAIGAAGGNAHTSGGSLAFTGVAVMGIGGLGLVLLGGGVVLLLAGRRRAPAASHR